VPRRLFTLLAICVADYLLWRWSSASGPQAVALVSGLALLPLALAGLVLGVGTLMRRVRRKPARAASGARSAAAVEVHQETVEKPERVAA